MRPISSLAGGLCCAAVKTSTLKPGYLGHNLGLAVTPNEVPHVSESQFLYL